MRPRLDMGVRVQNDADPALPPGHHRGEAQVAERVDRALLLPVVLAEIHGDAAVTLRWVWCTRILCIAKIVHLWNCLRLKPRNPWEARSD